MASAVSRFEGNLENTKTTKVTKITKAAGLSRRWHGTRKGSGDERFALDIHLGGLGVLGDLGVSIFLVHRPGGESGGEAGGCAARGAGAGAEPGAALPCLPEPVDRR